MSEEMMTTKELTRYLRINRMQVYHLISQNRMPSTKVGRKWIFPRKLIDEWIESSASLPQQTKEVPEGRLLASGTKDMVLDMLCARVGSKYPDFPLFCASTGSIEALKSLNLRHTDIAWCHLLDPESGEYNVPFVPIYAPDIRPVAVNLYHRDIGFLVAPSNPLHIRGFKDLARKNVRFVNRQKGSDTRTLIDHHVGGLNIDPGDIYGYDNEACTHLEVGLSVLSNEADAGIASATISRLLGLSFIHLAHERLDMILDEHTYFHSSVQALMEVLRSESFRGAVAKLGGYDLRDSGKVLYAQ